MQPQEPQTPDNGSRPDQDEAAAAAARRAVSPLNDPLIRYVIVNLGFGMGFGAAFAALVLWFDVSGLHRLIFTSSSPIPALILLFGSFMLTFGSLVCGTAIMLLPSDDDLPPPPGGRRDEKFGKPAALRVPVRRGDPR